MISVRQLGRRARIQGSTRGGRRQSEVGLTFQRFFVTGFAFLGGSPAVGTSVGFSCVAVPVRWPADERLLLICVGSRVGLFRLVLV